MTNLKADIDKLPWQEACPSLQIAVQHKGEWLENICLGEPATYFDLASLTKIFFTTPLIYSLVTESKLHWTSEVGECLDWELPVSVQLADLLRHFSGYAWWNEYYTKISIPEPVNENKQWKKLEAILDKEEIKDRGKSIYSDIDFLVLGAMLRKIFDKNISEIWNEFSSLHHLNFHFCSNNQPKFDVSLYAPTENCPWRKKILQGEVHDDNTWALGGVSTHAGLFGSLEDCKIIAEKFRKNYLGESIFCSSEDLKMNWQRKTSQELGDWAYGFMLPSENSSCGKYFSKNSVGHTGFTGTSYWYDFERDLQIIILSNRVHPSRDNKKFVKLRPILHDTIFQYLLREENL